jgi:two-component system phosphate regulon sensor histidine kinase PhoR
LNTKWVLGYILPVKDEQGHVQQVVLMHQDITERKQVEAQQLELALTRERTDLLKDLLNTFSHDLKTPLSIIDINLYLLEKISDPADQKSKIDTIKSQIHRLNKMIENMLMASYLDTAPASAVQPLDLNTVLDQIRQDFSAVAEDRSIRLEFMADSTLPLVPVNEVEMRRVLVNLVENALYYTPFDGQITLRTFKRDNLIVVEVSDTGIGIEEVDLPHIFEHFYRTDKARATHTGGTGLGLSIAKKIVERNGGRLEVQSIFGQGSTFRVWLPLSQETISE